MGKKHFVEKEKWKTTKSGFVITLTPTWEESARFANWMLSRDLVDYPFTVTFHPAHKANDDFLHQSRMEFAGGPLAAMVSSGFEETVQRKLSLSFKDGPRVFRALKHFLYGVELSFNLLEVSAMVSTAHSAHRWNLPLFQYLCQCFRKYDLLLSGHLVQARNLTKLPEVPSDFVEYYWKTVGRRYDAFRKMFPGTSSALPDPQADKSSDDSPMHLWTRNVYCVLWDMAISQEKSLIVMESIPGPVFKSTLGKDLLELIMVYIEPKLVDDRDVITMLQILCRHLGNNHGRKCDVHEFLEAILGGELDDRCSARSMRLLALAASLQWKQLLPALQ